MDSSIITDIDTIFADEFHTESFTHVNGVVTETLYGIFNRDGITVLSDIETSTLELLLKTSDMTNVDRDSEFTNDSDGVTYYPVEIGPDEVGITTIKLSRNKL